MRRKRLAREIKRELLAHMEDAARTEADFNAVIAQWDHLDKNRERREGNHEIGRSSVEMLHWDRISEKDEKGTIKENLGIVIPRPLEHHYWRQLMHGDFMDTIYDNAFEMWQLIEDWGIAALVKGLTDKQKEVLFLRAVRLCTAAQIALCHDKTDRAVRKLFAAALDTIRDKLASLIREQIEYGFPELTPAKRGFLDWYDQEKNALVDSGISK